MVSAKMGDGETVTNGNGSSNGEERAALKARFVKLFNHAYANSLEYRRLCQEAGVEPGRVKGLDDLNWLPLLRLKQIFEKQRENPPWGGFETKEIRETGRLFVNPGFICQPGLEKGAENSWAEALEAAGFDASDLVINTFSYHFWPYSFIMDKAVQRLGGRVIPTGGGGSYMQIRIIRQLGVTGYLGTPSFLTALAERAEELGLASQLPLSLKKALVGAERLPQSLRLRLEEKWGLRVHQAYGTVFLGCLGYECDRAEGFHVPKGALIQIVDPQDGRVLEPGKVGEVVGTSFSRAYPLIRLATGDLARLETGACSCGRGGLRLSRILGRTDQAVKIRGTFIHPWQTDEIMADHPEVVNYQVVVNRKGDRDELIFRVELNREEEGFVSRLERRIKDRLIVGGRVEVVPRGSIPEFHGKIIDQRSWD